MCRNIKTLFNFEPPATEAEIHDASLQFVRKLSGTTKPAKVNEAVFDAAVENISHIVQELLSSMVTSANPKNREYELVKARNRNALRFK